MTSGSAWDEARNSLPIPAPALRHSSRLATMATKTPPAPCTDQERAHFATRLRKWRAERGFFLKQVATDFGVAEATWSRWEKQERFPSPGNLRLLAEFIGVPICCFFYQDEASCPNCSQNRKKPDEPKP